MRPFLILKVLQRISKNRRLSAVSGIIAVLLTSIPYAGASAHPLGNFTVNHYARLEIAETQLKLYFVLDLAEIPTFQEKETIDTNGDGTLSDAERTKYLDAEMQKVKSSLHLEVAGKPIALRLIPDSAQIEFLPGQGGLEIMRLGAQFAAPLELNSAAVPIVYRDATYQERIGWREIVARPGDGITLLQSNVHTTETSDELRKYPQDLLSNPLNDREANLIVVYGASGVSANPGNIGGGKTWIVFGFIGFVILAACGGIVLILRRRP